MTYAGACASLALDMLSAWKAPVRRETRRGFRVKELHTYMIYNLLKQCDVFLSSPGAVC